MNYFLNPLTIICLIILIATVLLPYTNTRINNSKCKSNTFPTHYSPSTGCLIEVQRGKWQSINNNQGK